MQNLVPNSCMILVQDCKWPAVSRLPGSTLHLIERSVITARVVRLRPRNDVYTSSPGKPCHIDS